MNDPILELVLFAKDLSVNSQIRLRSFFKSLWQRSANSLWLGNVTFSFDLAQSALKCMQITAFTDFIVFLNILAYFQYPELIRFFGVFDLSLFIAYTLSILHIY